MTDRERFERWFRNWRFNYKIADERAFDIWQAALDDMADLCQCDDKARAPIITWDPDNRRIVECRTCGLPTRLRVP